EFKTNKIDGEFPNYELVLPKDFEYVITLDKTAFSKAIRRAAIVTESQTSAVTFKFKPDELELEAKTFDLGSYKGNLYKPQIEYEGKPFELSINQTYLMKTLNVMETDKITMHVKSPSHPIIFREEDHLDTLFLVMPIKM
ncbi:MAG TPA: DNA polymerase III subunit beta, partial [Candidatus Sumerlaeota bacterium]|nr:DNA polymerase III subunit beta [Candidatus Sumerlaeota bacterium]